MCGERLQAYDALVSHKLDELYRNIRCDVIQDGKRIPLHQGAPRERMLRVPEGLPPTVTFTAGLACSRALFDRMVLLSKHMLLHIRGQEVVNTEFPRRGVKREVVYEKLTPRSLQQEANRGRRRANAVNLVMSALSTVADGFDLAGCAVGPASATSMAEYVAAMARAERKRAGHSPDAHMMRALAATTLGRQSVATVPLERVEHAECSSTSRPTKRLIRRAIVHMHKRLDPARQFQPSLYTQPAMGPVPKRVVGGGALSHSQSAKILPPFPSTGQAAGLLGALRTSASMSGIPAMAKEINQLNETTLNMLVRGDKRPPAGVPSPWERFTAPSPQPYLSDAAHYQREVWSPKKKFHTNQAGAGPR